MPSARGLLSLSLLLATSAHGALFVDPSALPRTTYDFIIVGGGTAGAALASRISAFSRAPSVLLVEAGIDNNGVLPTIIPFLVTSLVPASPETWNFTTVPQVGLGGRAVSYPRGKMLGGSSSVNFMTYTRGASDDFDRWAQITGDAGWSSANLQQFFQKSERMVPPGNATSLNDVIAQNQALPNLHGSGPVEVSIGGFTTPLDHRIIGTARSIANLTGPQTSAGLGGTLVDGGDEGFGFNADYLQGGQIGFSFLQSTIGNSARSSSAVAYLDGPGVINRTNLDVLILTQANRLIRTSNGTKGGLPEYKAVEVQQTPTSPKFTLRANLEIVLSAGTIGTPQILMLSGIGNKTALSAFAASTQNTTSSVVLPPTSQIIDLPDVGQNLQDHPLLPNYFLVNSSLPNSGTFDAVLPNRDVNGTFGAQLVEEWMTTGSGILVDAPANTLGFVRLAEGTPNLSNRTNVPCRGFPFTNDPNVNSRKGQGIFKLVGNKEVVPNAPGLGSIAGVAGQDPTAGPGSAHYEVLFANLFAPFGVPPPTVGNFITAVIAVVSPLSRGSVTLASLNPFDFPLIDPALLAHPFDRATMVRAMRGAQTFLSSTSSAAGFGPKTNQFTDGFILSTTMGLPDVRNATAFSTNNPQAGFTSVDEADDEALLNYAVQTTQTVWHPVGTARMSPTKASWGVVDSQLKVKKITGVRIVDASVFPVITAGHPVAAVYIFAERAAQLIKLDHGF